jgi:hypothetical protein
VLLHEAFGDHQVANVTTEVEARTIGAHLPAARSRPAHSDVNPYYGIPRSRAIPFDGSAIVVWDSGTPTPPTTNTPNRRLRPALQAAQLRRCAHAEVGVPEGGGAVVDVWRGAPCLAP